MNEPKPIMESVAYPSKARKAVNGVLVYYRVVTPEYTTKWYLNKQRAIKEAKEHQPQEEAECTT